MKTFFFNSRNNFFFSRNISTFAKKYFNPIQPSPLVSSKIKQYNSIIRYDNYYFATVAKNSNSQQGLIFDCQRNSTAQFGCANLFNEIVYNYYYLNNLNYNLNYNHYLGQQNPTLLKHSYAPDSNQVICQ